jgi:hypothetical protein
MRAREMMKRLDRLPKGKGGVQKVPDLSLLSPEKQDRVDELFKVLLDSKDISSKTFDTAFAEFDKLVRDLPLLGPDDPEQGSLIEVPQELAAYWQLQQPASKWRSYSFNKLSKVQTLRFVELCEQYGFKRGADTPVKAQMLPLHEWAAGDRAELQHMLNIVASRTP